MVDTEIVESSQRYLQALTSKGLPVRFGVIFGSYARGNADYWSDIDLLVVSPQFDGVKSREAISMLWRVAARTDSRIEPVPCGERQWAEDTSSALVEIARREGERILPSA